MRWFLPLISHFLYESDIHTRLFRLYHSQGSPLPGIGLFACCLTRAHYRRKESRSGKGLLLYIFLYGASGGGAVFMIMHRCSRGGGSLYRVEYTVQRGFLKPVELSSREVRESKTLRTSWGCTNVDAHSTHGRRASGKTVNSRARLEYTGIVLQEHWKYYYSINPFFSFFHTNFNSIFSSPRSRPNNKIQKVLSRCHAVTIVISSQMRRARRIRP